MNIAAGQSSRSPSAIAEGLGEILGSAFPGEAPPEPAAVTVELCKEAAAQLRELESATGQSAATVLALSLGLMETVVRARQQGNQILLVSRFGIPRRRVGLPVF